MRALCIAVILMLLAACGGHKPKNIRDGCDIFLDKKSWYRAADKSYRKWGIPVSIQLAIIYQESRFVHNAKTPRRKLLWVIPWKRQSSAYGYGQVQKNTWKRYKRSRGRRGADRNNFKHVVDFIGWYGNISHRKLGIKKNDAYHLYLAYHEGHGGFARRSYRRKAWLKTIARKVQRRADTYQRQLDRCERKLRRKKFLWIF